MKQSFPGLFAVILVLAAGAALTAQSARAPRVGELYPDLTLPSLKDGRPLSLSSFRGKKIMLIQFASW